MRKKAVDSEPKVAIVYDRVNTRFGGAEHVLTELHALYPDAPLFTSVYDSEKAEWAKIFQVIPSFIQRIPILKNFHRSIVWLMPIAFETINLKPFDLVISVTSAEAKGVLTSPDQLHVCYLLTPTRYLWSHQNEYERHWLTGGLRKIVFKYLKWWDTAAAYRPDVIIPISKLVQQRTEAYYHRQTLPVIYPPVTLNTQASSLVELDEARQIIANLKEYYVIVARLVNYKRIDLAIEACQKLGKNLLIIGEGPDRAQLEKIAAAAKLPSSHVKFISDVSDQQISFYYQHARAFIAPAEEDFGIATLEAQLAGIPVVVYQKSGAAELIQPNKTGVYLEEQTVEDLTRCLKKIESTVWNAHQITESVANLDAVQFQSRFKTMVTEQWQLFVKGNLSSK